MYRIPWPYDCSVNNLINAYVSILYLSEFFTVRKQVGLKGTWVCKCMIVSRQCVCKRCSPNSFILSDFQEGKLSPLDFQ